MKRKVLHIVVTFSIFLLTISICIAPSESCKDVVVVGNATAGDFNLLMKVRDPSRPGPQVLCMIDSGYTYRYHLPGIRNKEKEFVVTHKFIGVVTKGDTPPNIVKPGMVLTDAGLAIGDADSPSLWINPTRKSWDDFDWIRYACQSADDEDEAIELLKEVVKMHAPCVSENLFVVGPRKAYVMEGDAFRYSVREIEDILVMSNYPKDLWKYRIMRRLLIARSFDFEKKEIIRKGSIVRLGGVLGVRIYDIDTKGIYVKLWPVGEEIRIKCGEGKVVGPFWVEVLDIEGKRAEIRICYKYKEWEKEIINKLEERYGKIDVLDLMELSRLQIEDLKGIRGMSEGYNEGTAICKIPYTLYDYLSCLWFSPNQCSSIYIPVHICCRDIYEAYTNGSAANLSVEILQLFGRSGFSDYAERVEEVFVREVEVVEKIARKLIEKGKDPSLFLTRVDMEMQKQAYLTELFVVSLKKEGKDIPMLWENNYSSTLLRFFLLSKELDAKYLKIMGKIAKSIARLKLEEFNITGYMDINRLKIFQTGIKCIDGGNFESGFLELYNFIEFHPDTEGLKKNLPREYDQSVPLLIVGVAASILISILSRRR